VAQAIKDVMDSDGYTSIKQVISALKYSGSTRKGTNQDAIDAVDYIFEQGGYAVKHRIIYFYAYRYTKSRWHESQNFIVQYNGHRIFDRWK